MSESDQVNLTTPCAKLTSRKTPRSTGGQKMKTCDECQFAIVDFVMLIAMMGALGGLLFPYAKIVTMSCVGIVGVGLCIIKEEISYAPGLYRTLALGMVCVALVALMIMVFICTCTKCGRPGCEGIRMRRAFEVKILTEEDLRSSSNGPFKDVVVVGLERIPREAIMHMVNRLKKVAPPNGKIVVIHRSGCGCFAGKVEVSGPRSVTPRGKIRSR